MLQGVKRRIINAMGGAQKYEGSPVQASSTALTAKNHPVIFQDAVLDAFTKESGGVISPPLDQLTIHPHRGYDIPHPRVDGLSIMRIEVLLEFLPQDMVVVTTYNTRYHEMLIHDLRGGKRNVPHHHVALIDLLRLFVEEEGRKHATRALAARAFRNIKINLNESWLAAASRLIRHYRAFTVDPEAPYGTEETYFWSLLSASNLELLQEKAIELCIPSVLNRTTKKAHLDLHKDAWSPQLEVMHVIRHEVNSLPMHQPCAFVRNIYGKFSNSLAKNAEKYIQQPQRASARATADINAVRSNRLSINERMYPSEMFTQAAASKPSARCAVEDEHGYIHGEDMPGDPFAAMAAQEEPPSRKRAWEDQQSEIQSTSRQRRSKDDRPHAPRFQAQGSTGNLFHRYPWGGWPSVSRRPPAPPPQAVATKGRAATGRSSPGRRPPEGTRIHQGA